MGADEIGHSGHDVACCCGVLGCASEEITKIHAGAFHLSYDGRPAFVVSDDFVEWAHERFGPRHALDGVLHFAP